MTTRHTELKRCTEISSGSLTKSNNISHSIRCWKPQMCRWNRVPIRYVVTLLEGRKYWIITSLEVWKLLPSEAVFTESTQRICRGTGLADCTSFRYLHKKKFRLHLTCVCDSGWYRRHSWLNSAYDKHYTNIWTGTKVLVQTERNDLLLRTSLRRLLYRWQSLVCIWWCNSERGHLSLMVPVCL